MTFFDSILRRNPVLLFYVLTFVLSWLCWIPLSLLQVPFMPGYFVILLGACIPSLVGLFLTYRLNGRAGLSEMFRRLRLWRVSPAWYAVVLLLPAAMVLSGIGLHILLGGEPPAFTNLNMWYLLPLAMLQVLLMGGPLQEELGWRGFVLPRWQAGTSSLVASLSMGVLWGVWHLPLFGIPYASQNSLPMVEFVLHDIALAVLFAWVYNNTQGSLWIALLFHASFNVTTWFLPIRIASTGDTRPMTLTVLIMFIVVAVIAFVFGPERLSRQVLDSPTQPESKRPFASPERTTL